MVELIRGFCQRGIDAPESGGVLLGYRRGAHLHVTKATTPTIHDRCSRTSFERAAEGHQAAALEHWSSSSGTGDYLGEWHTHPQVHPAPSDTDLVEWKKILAGPNPQKMVFLVVGTQTIWAGVGSAGVVRQVQLE
ncbi:Mov34/MPN/PAD-1 family protein [Stenotrophomonas sp. JC08]|uniref:Mov34/MPN/PAD-1 family protein n=1 Tax=Stenotrophomonas sp. JC08 TaxID=3445779 RepID=UPI003FA1C458